MSAAARGERTGVIVSSVLLLLLRKQAIYHHLACRASTWACRRTTQLHIPMQGQTWDIYRDIPSKTSGTR